MWAVALVLVMVSARFARADEAFSIGSRPAWFVLGGLSSGATVALDRRGPYVGGELSLVRVQGRGFVGLYADGYYDFAIDGTYLTIGPELGFVLRSRTLPISLGIDGGAGLRLSAEDKIGVAGRAFVTVAGSLSLSVRWLHFGLGEDDRVLQVGVTLKFPLAAPFGAATR